MIKIDKNIPIPDLAGKWAVTYPVREMEIGDSFAFDGGNEASVRTVACRIAKKLGRKFLVSGKNKRCWRIA